jgi:hypothetical protein
MNIIQSGTFTEMAGDSRSDLGGDLRIERHQVGQNRRSGRPTNREQKSPLTMAAVPAEDKEVGIWMRFNIEFRQKWIESE